VAEQHCGIARALAGDCGLGGLPGPMQFPLPVNERDEQWAAETHWAKGGRFAILTPGAGWGAKQWLAERYGALAGKLGELGVETLVNFGPGEEALAEAVERGSSGTARRGLYSLGKLMALCRRASVFVGGDTGPLHLAAALGTPVVALFGPTDPARNGPLGGPAVVLRSPVSATSHKRRAEYDPGLLSITADAVFAAAQRLLRR
jgi:heptosyltransferase-1